MPGGSGGSGHKNIGKPPEGHGLTNTLRGYRGNNPPGPRDQREYPIDRTGPPPTRDGFNDPDLVGSRNEIDNYDGSSSTTGGRTGNETTDGSGALGGGGGTGSGLSGRESSGLVGQTSGRSVEEIVYGIGKRKGRTKRARGE